MTNFFDRFDPPTPQPPAPAPGGNFFDQFDEPPQPTGPWTKYQAAPQPSGPWTRYQTAPNPAGPWTKYQASPAGTAATGTPGGPDPRYQTRFVSPATPEAGPGVPMPIPIPRPELRGNAEAAAAPPDDDDGGFGRWLLDVAASGADGIREGFTALPDMAVHAVDQAPRILNLPKMIPGMEDAYGDVGTVTEGSQAFLNWALGDGEFAVPDGADSRPVTLRDVSGGFGALDYRPQTGAGRFANRVGQELGASALPAGAAVAYGGRFVPAAGAPSAAHEGVRQLVEPFVRNPGAALSREAAGATAAGVGAATANAAHDAITGGEGGAWWTDLLGGIGGLGVAGAVEGLSRTGADIYRRVSNDPRYQQQIAGEAVADRLIDNSTAMQAERFAGRPLDADVLARSLDRQTPLEELVPGYRASTADRSGDSGLRSLAYNTESLAPGAANVRRERNMGAVGDHIRGLLPDGDGAAFLDSVRTTAAGHIDGAQAAAGTARGQLDEALDAVRPRMQPVDRGQTIRDDMNQVFDQRTAEYRQAYDARDAAMSGDRIEAGAPYRALQDEARRLTTYERDAYVPADIMASARRLAPEGAPAPEATGLLDQFGNPILRPRDITSAEIPLTEALSLRHGLTTRQREAIAAGRAPEHRALSRLSDGLRGTIDDAMSPETRALDARARELRRGVAADFEDGNLPSRILDQTARGRERMPAETIGPRVTAAETPYRDTMRLAGTRDGTRAAVRDQIFADAQNAGALRNQDTLNRFFADRAYAVGDFPDVRAGLEAAGASRTALDQAEAFARTQQARYAPGSNSPVGRFTRHDATGVADAMRGVWKSAEPSKAIKEVLDTAGRTPENLTNARAAFFEDMARTTTNSAHDAAGNIVWNGRVLDGFLKNPKVRAVMDELWTGDAQRKHLDDLRAIGSALIDSESSLRARPAASSGTASISLQGKVDPALTATSVASTLRSVSRGQLSKPIAGVHLLSGWIRGRSSRVQSAAINELMTKAMDDPRLAAELLRRHNPYDAQVKGRRFLRTHGVRVPQLANIINEELGGYSEQDQAFDAYMGAD